MFKSLREKELIGGKQEFLKELHLLRDRTESGEPPDLEKLLLLAEGLKSCHEKTLDDRICAKCKNCFCPKANPNHAELLISWCKDPEGKIVVAGIHEQHYLILCKCCYDELDLENYWNEFKPEHLKTPQKVKADKDEPDNS